MILNIINNTSYEKLFLCLNGREYQLSKGENSSYFIDEKTEKLSFKIQDNNRVVFSWLFAMIDELISEDHIWLKLNCNAEFDVYFHSEDRCTLYIEDFKSYMMSKHSSTAECYYKSVYLTGENLSVNNSVYSLTECKKQKNRSLFLLRFIVSWLPIVAALLALALLAEEMVWVILAFTAIILWFFTIPSFKKAKRFKTYFTDESANISLCEEEHKWRINNGKPPELTDFIGKSINKLFDKIFKRK